MSGAEILSNAAPVPPAVRWRWALGLAAAAVLWFDPSSGVAAAILLGAGSYGLFRARKTFAAWRNPAVEVIEWAKADPAVVDYLRWAFCMTGKVPLLTADVACFMLDRIFDNWCNESALLLDRATAAEVDSVAAEFVHAGPFFVLNLARGNPIITETNTLQADEEGEHYRPAPIFKSVDTWVTVPPGKRVEVARATAKAVRERLLGILFSQSVDIVLCSDTVATSGGQLTYGSTCS